MKYYTSKVVAGWLGLTERRVRQLRDEGIISEAIPGFYDLKSTVTKYIGYIRGGGMNDLNGERAGLTRAKREAAEMENELKRRNVHRTEDIELGLKTLFFNIRSRFLTLPAKLSPPLADMNGNRDEIYDLIKNSIDEILEEMSDPEKALKRVEEELENDESE